MQLYYTEDYATDLAEVNRELFVNLKWWLDWIDLKGKLELRGDVASWGLVR